MVGETLTTTQRNALFALMAEAGEIANKDLTAKYRVDLNGRERIALNEAKLVGSRREGRGYVHELLPAGWERCAQELVAARSPRGNVAFFAVLTGLDRFLSRTGQTLADVFGQPAARDTPPAPEPRSKVEDAIVTAYRELAPRPGSYVKLATLRANLRGHAASKVTDALRKMAAAGTVVLTPEEDRRRIKPEDDTAAVRFGDLENHFVSIEAL